MTRLQTAATAPVQEAMTDLDHPDAKSYLARLLDGWEGDTGLIDLRQEPAQKQCTVQQLSKTETAALMALAQASDVTLPTIVAAAWGVVLARMTGRRDALFGMTLSERHLLPDTDAALGGFTVTVPVRIKIDHELTVGTLLHKVREDQIGLRLFEPTPLAHLRRFTDLPPGKPLVESLLRFETETLDHRRETYGEAGQDRRGVPAEEDNLPLTVTAYQDDALRIELEYDSQQVPLGDQLAGYLKNLLAELAKASSATRLADVSMLDDRETQTLERLAGSKEPQTDPSACCLTGFETQAARTPHHTALRQVNGDSLTFGELDAAANALAQSLVSRGIICGDAVGICALRSPAFIVAILAVWKAGAAFVPMDPTYPAPTLHIMAHDSGTKVILTDAAAPAFDQETLPLDQEQLHKRQAQAPDRGSLKGDRNAYILFTSGTTGRPKGVVISQASLAAHAAAAAKVFELSCEDRVLQFASLSFDVAIEEIVPTLLAGATLVLRSPQMSHSVSSFLQACEAQDITLLNLPTGFWVQLTLFLEAERTPLPPQLRMVIVGGERVPLLTLRRWRRIAPHVRWLNGYGPTETTITCTAYEVLGEALLTQSVPIGRPLAHAQAWVLAADGSLAPLGAQGELCISGSAVAKGYVTSKDKEPTGFQTREGGLLAGRSYRTGDRVQWQDSTLCFMGRMDRQLKIRGFRIDPNQIESLLEERSDIARAHVAVPKNGGDRLIAWYSVTDPNNPPSQLEIEADLAQKLPSYMRPALSQVHIWPRTPGGKIDVAALPLPQALIPSPKARPEDETPRARQVAELFEAVLETGPVPIDSSFFDLGGNSLSLLQLNTLLEKAYGARLEPSLLYQDPSPAGIARLLDTRPDQTSVIPLQPKGHRAPLYALHALGENNSFFLPLAEALSPEQPLFGITIGIRKEGLPTTVEEIAAFYVDQITHHRPNGPVALVAVSASSFITFEVAQQLLAAGRDVQALIFLDARGPDGRIRKSRLGHRWVHLKYLLKQGKPYLAKLREERRYERLHAETMARLKAAGTNAMTETDEEHAIAQFVASTELAISNYTPRPYPRKITIFKADDPFDSRAAGTNGLGWKSVAAGGFDIVKVKGGHVTMLYPPHVAGLAPHLQKCLE